MKFYKVQVELGHLGIGNSLPSWVYVKAKDIIKAIIKARRIPAVKHSRLPLEAIEISQEEYLLGLESNQYYDNIDQIFNA